MTEYILIGVAIAAAIATFAVLFKRTGGDCLP